MRISIAAAVLLAASVCAYGGGRYLQFDGNDVVIFPDSSSLEPTQMTVELQVNLGRISSGKGYGPRDNQSFIVKGNDFTAGAYQMAQLGDAVLPIVTIAGNPGKPDGGDLGMWHPLVTDRWYHMAMTYDGDVLKLYLDGEVKGTKTIGAVTPGNSLPLYLGYNASPGFEFFLTGAMDEVRVWDHARSGDEIAANMWSALTGTEAGLRGYWDFEEALDSQTVIDRSGNGNSGWLGWGTGVDGGDPTRVPEPATLVVLTLGGLALIRRKQRRR